MEWKKIGKAILFPNIAIRIILLPIATVWLICSMIFIGTKSIIAIISYVLATYTLTVWCVKIPDLIRIIKRFKSENKYARIWASDTGLRVNTSLYGSLIWNAAYSAIWLGLGFYHKSFWFFSLSGYYVLLAAIRFYIVRYTRKNSPGERMRQELIRYRACGIVFLVMNMFLSLMIFFMVYWNRTFSHHEITTIAMAAYTFRALTIAIVNVVKYRKYNSPAYSASKAISLAAACVSLLTLETTMLTTFDKGEMSLTGKRIMLGASGGVISLFIIVMSIYMIVQSNKKLKMLNAKKE